MPRTLSAIAIAEKNKLATDSVFLTCLEITIPGEANPIRVVNNSESITWQGEQWVSFPFEIDEITENSTSEVPQVNLRISNVSRAIEAYLQDYDVYVKLNGPSPITVKIYVVNSENLASATPEVEHEFELVKPQTNSQWATFTLGAPNIWSKRFPAHKTSKDHCWYREFKGDRCGYSGGETECDRTLDRCRELSNSARFGAAPGIGYGGIVIVT